MDCYFRQYWRDTRLKFHGPMKSLSLSIKVHIYIHAYLSFSDKTIKTTIYILRCWKESGVQIPFSIMESTPTSTPSRYPINCYA